MPFDRTQREKEVREERALLKRAAAGDAEAFGKLYEKHATRIYNVCLRMVRDPSIAEDLLHEAFLHAFRRIHTFRGDSLFSTWLHRIAVNEVLMHFRRCKTNPVANADHDTDGDEDELPRTERFMTEDIRLSHATERIALERAILRLPPGYRIMFVLHDLEGYEHSEIAAVLGCTPGNTKSQLFKARRRLRSLLMDGNGGYYREAA